MTKCKSKAFVSFFILFIFLCSILLLKFNSQLVIAQDLDSDEDFDGLNLSEEISLGSDPTIKDIFIEVDFLNSNISDVIEPFAQVKEFFAQYNVNIWVEYNSSNNIIDNVPNLYNKHLAQGVIERLYHDYPLTHIYLIIADDHPFRAGIYGDADPDYGIIIDLDFINDDAKIAGILMHEIGHCIGIGLHDDVDGKEVYAFNGFMTHNSYDYSTYNTDDWNDSLAPDNYFSELGDSKIYDARFWNKESVRGELSDERALIIGNVKSANGSFLPVGIVEIETDNSTNQNLSIEGEVKENGDYYAFIPPGNVTIRFNGYNEKGDIIESKDISINVSKYEIIRDLDVTLDELNKINKEKGPPWLFTVAIVLFLVGIIFVLYFRKSP